MERKQLIDTINRSIFFALANLHTATIARVERVNDTTLDLQPVINRTVNGESIALTVFKEVPPVFLQGGGSYSAHPIAAGDYCLLILTERCFDRWYDGQDEREPAEYRMHDYSDGLAVVGVNPRAGALTIPDVITHIGDSYLEGNYEHQGDYDQTGNLTRQGTSNQTGDETVTGNSTVNGDETVTGQLAVGSIVGTGGGAVTSTVPIQTTANVDAASYSVGGTPGVSGTFGNSVTVVNGIVTGGS